jgi:hypothetical protein
VRDDSKPVAGTGSPDSSTFREHVEGKCRPVRSDISNTRATYVRGLLKFDTGYYALVIGVQSIRVRNGDLEMFFPRLVALGLDIKMFPMTRVDGIAGSEAPWSGADGMAQAVVLAKSGRGPTGGGASTAPCSVLSSPS